MALPQTFSDRLRNTRIQRGLMAIEVAERVGVSVSALYEWEAGRGLPKYKNLSNRCARLSVCRLKKPDSLLAVTWHCKEHVDSGRIWI